MSLGVKGVPVVLNGTAATSGARIAVTNQNGKPSFARALYFRNTDTTNNIKLSFGGSAYLTVKPGEERNFEFNFTSFVVQSSAGTPAYEAIATVAA